MLSPAQDGQPVRQFNNLEAPWAGRRCSQSLVMNVGLSSDSKPVAKSSAVTRLTASLTSAGASECFRSFCQKSSGCPTEVASSTRLTGCIETISCPDYNRAGLAGWPTGRLRSQGFGICLAPTPKHAHCEQAALSREDTPTPLG